MAYYVPLELGAYNSSVYNCDDWDFDSHVVDAFTDDEATGNSGYRIRHACHVGIRLEEPTRIKRLELLCSTSNGYTYNYWYSSYYIFWSVYYRGENETTWHQATTHQIPPLEQTNYDDEDLVALVFDFDSNDITVPIHEIRLCFYDSNNPSYGPYVGQYYNYAYIEEIQVSKWLPTGVQGIIGQADYDQHAMKPVARRIFVYDIDSDELIGMTDTTEQDNSFTVITEDVDSCVVVAIDLNAPANTKRATISDIIEPSDINV